MAAGRVDAHVEEPSRHQATSSPPQIPRRAGLAAGAGLGAAGLLALVGPHPVGSAAGRSGDPALLARVEPHLRGLNRVALAYLVGDATRYAGIGADERTPFEIGSVSKTFCGAVLMDMVAKGEVTPRHDGQRHHRCGRLGAGRRGVAGARRRTRRGRQTSRPAKPAAATRVELPREQTRRRQQDLIGRRSSRTSASSCLIFAASPWWWCPAVRRRRSRPVCTSRATCPRSPHASSHPDHRRVQRQLRVPPFGPPARAASPAPATPADTSSVLARSASSRGFRPSTKAGAVHAVCLEQRPVDQQLSSISQRRKVLAVSFVRDRSPRTWPRARGPWDPRSGWSVLIWPGCHLPAAQRRGRDPDKEVAHSRRPGDTARGPEPHHLVGSHDPLGPSVHHDAPPLVVLLVEFVDFEGNVGRLASSDSGPYGEVGKITLGSCQT